MIASFLGVWLQVWPVELLAFSSDQALAKPWTLATHPIAMSAGGLLGVIFGSLWMWGIGAVVEREVSSKRFAGIALLFAVLTALLAYTASMVLGQGVNLLGIYPLLALVTVMWGTRYPEQTVMFMMIIPVKAKWLAWISAGLVFFSAEPRVAPFLIVPLVLGYFFAADKLPVPYYAGRSRRKDEPTYGRTGKVDTSFLDDVKRREQERAEKERLRKLFESSMIDNTKDDDERGAR